MLIANNFWPKLFSKLEKTSFHALLFFLWSLYLSLQVSGFFVLTPLISIKRAVNPLLLLRSTEFLTILFDHNYSFKIKGAQEDQRMCVFGMVLSFFVGSLTVRSSRQGRVNCSVSAFLQSCKGTNFLIASNILGRLVLLLANQSCIIIWWIDHSVYEEIHFCLVSPCSLYPIN